MIFDAEFVYHWPYWGLPGVPLIYRCRFNKSHLNEDSYDRYGIVMPGSLKMACRKRKAEYLAGRYAASKVLEQFGYVGYTLLPNQDGIPRWPSGIQASISHNDSTAICVASMGNGIIRGVGVDVERYIGLDLQSSVGDLISSPAERALLMEAGVPLAAALTLIFSAKESFFKAVYPLVKSYFDFKVAELVGINTVAKTFCIKLLCNLDDSFVKGWTAKGSYMESKDEITTMIGIK